jgi:hypothetical protein
VWLGADAMQVTRKQQTGMAFSNMISTMRCSAAHDVCNIRLLKSKLQRDLKWCKRRIAACQTTVCQYHSVTSRYQRYSPTAWHRHSVQQVHHCPVCSVGGAFCLQRVEWELRVGQVAIQILQQQQQQCDDSNVTKAVDVM